MINSKVVEEVLGLKKSMQASFESSKGELWSCNQSKLPSTLFFIYLSV